MRKYLQNVSAKRMEQLRILGILALLIPFFKPGYFELCVPATDMLYKAAKAISALVVFVMCVKEIKESKRVSMAACAMIGVELWAIVDILIHQGLYVSQITQAVYVLVVCAMIEVLARRHAGELLQAFLILYEVLICLNFVCMLLIPGGMYYTAPDNTWKNWLLGYRNMFLFYFIPSLALELLNKHRTGKSLRLHVMMIICTVSMALSTSKTGLIGILLFDAVYMTRIYLKRVFHSLTVTAAYLAAFVSIVFLGIQNVLQPVFALLNRDVTFTGRTKIWETMLRLIYENPLLGYGVQSEEVRGEVSGLWYGVKAHNFILEQQYCFGLIGTVLMGCFLGVMVYALYTSRKHPFAASLCLGVACYCALMLMESHINYIPMYSFLFLACQVRPFIEQLSENPSGLSKA